tara:strand:- start:65 stop:1018 length:954 start_codon:yes stop_codon:yes gene_type:complete
MDLYKIKNGSLEEINNESFNLEKDIQSLVENNLETLFNLEFVSTEFTIGEFRLDTLCYDNDTNSFVIIEYKKGSSYSVIDQGYSYMSVMLNNKSDFILEYNERKDTTLKRDKIDWSQSKIIFISQSFNTYQKNSVNFKDVPFELWEIKKFSNNTISLNQYKSSSKESIKNIEGGEDTIIKGVNKEVKLYDEEHHADKVDSKTLELWFNLKQRLLEFDNVELKYTKYYIRLVYDNQNLCELKFRKGRMEISVHRGITYQDDRKSTNFFTWDDPKQISKSSSWTWKSGNKGNVYIVQYDKTNLDYILFLIKQKYDSRSS